MGMSGSASFQKQRRRLCNRNEADRLIIELTRRGAVSPGSVDHWQRVVDGVYLVRGREKRMLRVCRFQPHKKPRPCCPCRCRVQQTLADPPVVAGATVAPVQRGPGLHWLSPTSVDIGQHASPSRVVNASPGGKLRRLPSATTGYFAYCAAARSLACATKAAKRGSL